MSDPELRDYIAIQAMAAMLHHESMASNHAIENMKDPSDESAAEWMDELTYSSFQIADAMMRTRDERSDPKFLEQIQQAHAATKLADEMENQ